MIKILFKTIVISAAFISNVMAQDILPELKPEALVNDTVITLGDLFRDLDEKSDLVIASAPEPGKRVLIPARQVLAVTRANDIRWNNSAAVKNVIVKRMSTILTVHDLKDILVNAIQDQYLGFQEFDVRFYNQNTKIHVPNGYDVSDLEIKDLVLDSKNSKFTAMIAAPTGAGTETLYKINGRTMKVALIPTLGTTLRKGSIINASNINWVSVPESQVGRNIIRNEDQLVGMTPRTQIREGAPIRLSEVNRPTLVKRGALVKINFNTNKISLSTIGKAVQDGGKGDVIQVKNPSSNKIITAVVLGENQVQVGNDLGSLVLLNQ